MESIKKIAASSATLLFLPLLTLAAYADPAEPTGAFTTFADMFGKILSLIWPIVAGLAAIMIVVAGIVFITANGDPDKIQTARNSLIWAIIGIVVAILAWSIPNIVSTLMAG